MNNSSDQHEKDRVTPNIFLLILILVLAMSLYAFLRLSTARWIEPLTLIMLVVLETLVIALSYKRWSKLDVWFECAANLVFIAIAFGLYKQTFVANETVWIATIFYRPYYLMYGNRRLAFILSLLIAATVLPIATGFASDAGVVQGLTLFYSLFVFSLWVFCSRLGSKLFEA